jgi:hypothetical protein
MEGSVFPIFEGPLILLVAFFAKTSKLLIFPFSYLPPNKEKTRDRYEEMWVHGIGILSWRMFVRKGRYLP